MNDPIIPSRFRGPPTSGNGGFACGVAARYIEGAAEVTLRKPPPLDVALQVSSSNGGLRLLHGDDTVIEARSVPAPGGAPPFVSLDQARAAQPDPTTMQTHVFPECFVCGPARAPRDGLRIFVGELQDDIYAAAWTPDDTVTDESGEVMTEVMWAALDCPSGWTAFASNVTGSVLVLGRLTAAVRRTPRAGEEVVVTARARGSEGRKHFAASAIYDANGDLLANADATWIRLSGEPR